MYVLGTSGCRQPQWKQSASHSGRHLHCKTLLKPVVQAWALPGTPIEVYSHHEMFRNASVYNASSVLGATAVRFVEPNFGELV